MRRKKSFTEISAYDLWYKPGIGWIMNPEHGPYSDHKSYRTMQKALRVARAILIKYPMIKEVYIERWYYKKGERYVKEYVLRRH